MENDKMEYWVPMTINELISGLKGLVKHSADLTGEELVIGTTFIDEDYDEAPPCSIVFHLRRNTLDPDEPKVGTIILTPGKTKTIM